MRTYKKLKGTLKAYYKRQKVVTCVLQLIKQTGCIDMCVFYILRVFQMQSLPIKMWLKKATLQKMKPPSFEGKI
jgi:hypothetical protein